MRLTVSLSQEQEELEEQPHQNKPEGKVLGVLNLAHSLAKPN